MNFVLDNLNTKLYSLEPDGQNVVIESSIFFFKILLTGGIPSHQEHGFNLRNTSQGLTLDCPES